jgi:hypothetical protein
MNRRTEYSSTNAERSVLSPLWKHEMLKHETERMKCWS